MTQPHSEESTRQPPGGVFVGLVAFTGIMGVTAAVLGVKLYGMETGARDDFMPLFLWSLLNAVIGAVTIFWTKVPSTWVSTAGNPPPDKLIIMTTGALLGLSTLGFIGVMYGLHWWDLMTKGREAWQDWKPWVPVLGVFGGLAIMFMSLMAARSEEQTNATMRWLIYGYNAALTGLLLLTILIIVNIVTYFQGTQIFDWTASHIYDLSDTTTQLLKGLERPVKVYVMMSSGDPTRDDLATMLTNSARYSDKLEVHYLDPEYIGDIQEVNAIARKYDVLEREGMLVVYEGPDGKEITQFMKKTPDIEDASMGMGARPGESERVFKGEQALVSAITILQEGKANPVIYFTQDNDELKLDDSSREPQRGLATLRTRMEKDNFTVKDLSLTPDPKTGVAKVPDDATVVVITGPQQPMPKAKIDALRDYMSREPADKEKGKRGKLVVMVDLNRDPLKKDLFPPGQEALEGLLAEYGVQVGHDIILNAQMIERDPTIFWAGVSRQADSSLPDLFRQVSFVLFKSRSMRPAPQSGAFVASPFLEVNKQRFPYQWAEDKLEGTPREFVEKLIDNSAAIAAKRDQPAAPVAVTVREKSAAAANPNDPHAFMRQSDGEPRLIALGTTSMVTNQNLDHPQLGQVYYKMFTSSLAWVRGRSSLIAAVPPKTRKDYHFNLTQAQYGTMMWIPGPLLLLAIGGCGLGVWYLRRR
jgi:hypothetical protein